MPHPEERNYVAIDLGAESGRVMVGTVGPDSLSLREMHRFSNRIQESALGLTWDFGGLIEEIEIGLRSVAREGLAITSVSIDSWGVDYALTTDDRGWLEPVYAYRDGRSERGAKEALATLSWERLFDTTGIQYMAINSVFQLRTEPAERLKQTDHVLGIADAVARHLGARPASERSLASTTQLYNPTTQDWAWDIIEELGYPRSIFPPIVDAGAEIGALAPELQERTGLGSIPIIAGLSHDTAAAVAAVPATDERWAYLSSGTWSLIGVELEHPIINNTTRQHNYTNEIGWGGSVRLLQNIIGLWLAQELRREWTANGQNWDYQELTQMALDAAPFRSLIDPRDPRFLAPGGMESRIQDFLRESGQPTPDSPGAMMRCVFESLALLYGEAMDAIEAITHWRPETLHIVGGGSQNDALNQWTANATQRRVVAGPTEATAIGVVLAQAIASGQLESLADARCLVLHATETKTFEPQDQERWTAARARFRSLSTA